MDKKEQRIRIILNPAAAKGKAASLKGVIDQYLTQHGISAEFVETQRVWHAVQLAKQAAEEGVDVIVAAGGDGTCNEVANGIMAADLPVEKRPKLAIFPIGRGNDFAYVCEIPKRVEAFCDLLIQGKSRNIDVGKVFGGLYPEGRFFLNGVGVGFEPMVTMKASEYKKISGIPSYIVALLSVVAHYPAAVPTRIDIDGEIKEISTQQISICNGRRMGGAFLMGPDAIPYDGLLDYLFIDRPLSVGMILRLVLKFLKGSQKSHPYVQSGLAESLEVSAFSDKLICHADGETISKGCDSLKVEIKSGAIQLICTI